MREMFRKSEWVLLLAYIWVFNNAIAVLFHIYFQILIDIEFGMEILFSEN